MQRIAFEFGGFSIHWYGVLVATGFLLGLTTASRRALKEGISPEVVVDLTLWLMLGAIIGARTLYVVTHWNQFANSPLWHIADIRSGGLVYYGGFLGALIAGWFYVRRRNLDFWRMADLLAPSIALGQFSGRLGCLMNGCCYGRPTDLPWRIFYPEPHELAGVGVHPTQLYESALSLAFFFALCAAHRRRTFHGQTFCLYLLGYGVLRAAIEMFRGDYAGPLRWGLTPGQWGSAAAIAAGIWLWRHRAPHVRATDDGRRTTDDGRRTTDDG